MNLIYCIIIYIIILFNYEILLFLSIILFYCINIGGSLLSICVRIISSRNY